MGYKHDWKKRESKSCVIQRDVPHEAYEVATSVVEILGPNFPDPMYIVDIALADGRYRLLEINGFSYSLLYDCDLDVVVRSAHAEAINEWDAMQLPAPRWLESFNHA